MTIKQTSTNNQQQTTIVEQPETRSYRPSTNNFGIHCIDPLGYLDFLCLVSNSRLVLTDSGGMEEETTVLGIPCVTIRENTERPITLSLGTNVIVGTGKGRIVEESFKKLKTNNLHNVDATQPSNYPPLWDGQAGQRIINILMDQIMKLT